MDDPSHVPAADAVSARAGEAARYAVLRRLAHALRHQVVAHLQPIGMTHALLARRLRAPQPDLDALRDGVQRIRGFARDGMQACLDVVGWLAPDPRADIELHDGVQECVGLLATPLGLQGFTLHTALAAGSGRVHRGTLRHVLSAALLHAVDVHKPPAVLRLSAQERAEGALLTLAITGGGAAQVAQADGEYRPLGWDDVEAVALQEGVLLHPHAHGCTLLLPWVRPAMPAA